jgi:hypothetical protein
MVLINRHSLSTSLDKPFFPRSNLNAHILTNFSPGSKLLHVNPRKWLFLVFALASVFSFLSGGCFYNFIPNHSFPFQDDINKYQPLAILPVEDFTGYPESGSNLYSSLFSSLAAKGFSLVPSDKLREVLAESDREIHRDSPMDPAFLWKIYERLNAKALIAATLLEYRVQKPNVRSKTFQVWEGSVYEYRTLPTYYPGSCVIKLNLKMWDVQSGLLIWMSAGQAEGPMHARDKLGSQLIDRLLKDLHPPAS